MALYGVSFVASVFAWDTVNNTYKTGDAANIALRWLKDGTDAATTNACSEVSAANAPGEYKVTVTATEAQCLCGTLGGKSSSTGIVIIPITFTFEQLPNVAPGANGGLPTADANNAVKVQAGTGTGQLDFTAGVVKSNVVQMLATAFTESGAGRLVAGIKQFFDIASPTSTMNVITSVTTAANLTTNNDKTGYALSAAGIQAIWDFATSLLTTVGSIGKRLVDNIDAAISSRSTYAGGDTAGTTTLLGRLTAGRATNLDNLDATVSSRSTLGGTAQTGDVYGLLTSAQAEPAAVPASNATPIVKIGYMFAKMRNKRLTTATTDTLRNDADSASIATASLSDDGTTFTKGKDT